MGTEAQMRRFGARKQNKSPPVFSHEFIIQNHADIMSCVAMVFVLGLMLKATQPIASIFVVLQHNITGPDAPVNTQWLYTNGRLDLATIFFITIICIVGHQVIQEYVLDKLKARVHLSKTKTAKFSESGQLAAWYLACVGAAGYILWNELDLSRVSILWEDYPASHLTMTFWLKLFFLIQISYWIHCFPEFYFQKTKKEEMRARTGYISLYLIFISAAYALNFTRVALAILFIHCTSELIYHVARITHFIEKPTISKSLWRLWNFAFLLARLGSVILAVLTFWYGLKLTETATMDPTTGNFNTAFVRLNCLLAVCCVQFWMVWNFITAGLRRARTSTPSGAHAKKRYDLRSASKKQQRAEAELRNLPEADQHAQEKKDD